MDNQFLVEMPEQLKADWLKDLRTTDAPQGIGRLQTTAGGYCCLGRLQLAAGDKDVERNADGTSRGFPSREWLKIHNIEGINNQFAFLDKCSIFNDHDKLSFKQIADVLEPLIKGV